jgi:hypothetical protein
MPSILSALGGAVVNKLFGGGGISNTDIQDATVGLYSMILQLANWSADLATTNLRAWEDNQGYIRRAGVDVQEIGSNDYYMWGHLLHAILPHSLAWLDGHTHQWVDGKYTPIINTINSRIGWLMENVKALVSWRKSFADPTLVNYRGWRTWFDGWPRGAVFTVQSWKTEPRAFYEFAVPKIAANLLAYYDLPAHNREAIQIAQIAVDHSPDVWRHVETAMVRVLLQEQ